MFALNTEPQSFWISESNQNFCHCMFSAHCHIEVIRLLLSPNMSMGYEPNNPAKHRMVSKRFSYAITESLCTTIIIFPIQAPEFWNALCRSTLS